MKKEKRIPTDGRFVPMSIPLIQNKFKWTYERAKKLAQDYDFIKMVYKDD